jgi:erythritol kinase
MRDKVLLALDSGTSVVKATAFDTTGALLASVARPNTYAVLADGGAEQDIARSWDDAAEVLAALVAELHVRHPGREVLALAVTGQGDGCWLVDEAAEPVGPGLIWLDSRASALVEALKASGAAAAAFAHTGTGIAACQMAPQLLWLEQERGDMLRRARWALHPKDLLFQRLTGTIATSPCEGSFTFGNFRTRTYEDEVLRVLGLSRHRRLLPPMLDGAVQARPLQPSAARRIGLPAGTPVVLGYIDVACTALGAGIYGTGTDAGISVIGSTGVHLRLVPNAAVSPCADQTGYCFAFPVPGHTMQGQTNMAATINIDWLVALAQDGAALHGGPSADQRQSMLLALDDAVLEGRPGAALYHPFISPSGERGPFTDALARASILGVDRFVRLADLARGIYEGLAMAARDCYTASGDVPSLIRLTGGAARSRALAAILAHVLDRPVLAAAQPEAGTAGAAMMAAVQQGVFPTMQDCASAWIAPDERPPALPRADLARFYDRLFAVYGRSRHAMRAIWHDLHAVRATLDAADGA